MTQVAKREHARLEPAQGKATGARKPRLKAAFRGAKARDQDPPQDSIHVAPVEHAPGGKPEPKPEATAQTKATIILSLLQRETGASLLELCEATGWQAHSVRGFLSAAVKKRLGLNLESAREEGGGRRYRVGVSEAPTA